MRRDRGVPVASEQHDLVGWSGERTPVRLGKAQTLREGADGAILAYGHMVQTALEAAALLAEEGVHVEVVNARFCKPLDEQFVVDLCNRHDHVVTLEDHVKVGGFGSAVLELLSEEGIQTPVRTLGIPDKLIEHGESASTLGLAAPDIAAAARALVAAAD